MNKLNCGVYKITNIENGKIYIGGTRNLNTRFGQHKNNLRNEIHKNRFMQEDYEQGGSVFEFNIILYCDKEMIFYYEQRAVNIMKPKYNICLEDVRNASGVKRTEEFKSAVSEKLLGNKNTVGEKNGRSKLIKSDILEIRRLRLVDGLFYKTIAELYPVSDVQISRICNREEWKQVK